MNWDAWYKTITTIVGATVGWLYGGWDPLLQILLAFAILDYVTGMLASGTEGKLSSSIGFKGIAKKIMIFIMVAAGHLVDVAIGNGSMIQDAVTFFYLGNELLSITENGGRIGLPIPSQVKSAIQILKGKGEGKE
jgi:toxin secretion/phage lysis holin